MKNNQNFILYFLILLLVGYVLFLQQCTPETPGTDENTIDTVSIVILKDTTIHDSIYFPVPYIEIRDSLIYYPVDTAAILADYFCRRVYNDTIIDDSSAFLVVTDTVTENKLFCRSYHFSQFPLITTIHTREIVEPNWTLSAGAILNGSSTRFGFSPSILLTRKNNTYTLGYDIINGEVSFGMYWRVF